MFIMGIQIILLLVVIAHTGTGNNNASGCIPCLSYSDSNSTTNNSTDSDCCLDETQDPGCCPDEINAVLEAMFPMPDLKRSECIPRACYYDPNSPTTYNNSDCCPGKILYMMEPDSKYYPNSSDCGPCPPSYYDYYSPTMNNDSDCCLDETGPMFPMPNLKSSLCIPRACYNDRISLTTYNNYTILQGFSVMWNISTESADFLKGVIVTRVMPSFYIFVILISLPLNAVALVTFTCRIKAKKPAVIYMSHLACVDLFFTLLLPLKIHYQLNASDWVFGEVACRVLSAAYYCYMYCSILLMMCISVDRLLAVALPITSQTWRSTRKATCVCVLVWLLALAGTVPLLSMRQTLKVEGVGVTCHDVLRQNDPSRLSYVYLFSILSCLYFFLPLVVTLVSYCTIIYVLRAKSEHLASSSSPSGVRRKAVIMAITVLIEFVLCFAATNGLLLYHYVRLATRRHIGEGDSSYVVYLLAVCLGSTSVVLDPLLYYYGSSQSRQQMRSVFWCRKAKKVKTVNI
ncbi:proteinase-activated receptor 1-like isoform X3 [Pimephales promelas]|uniref:proteinase-activated receptor 1-like isoform X3 n=1 Tax=Pimephales promelas TaxID=90988 RepID=UPI0019555119|nr:proteinase-activated receptor 1-like isoform X3 [Pimephales promelas]